MNGDPIEFRLLGPLEVRVGGRPLALGGPRQRALLGCLLLNANRPVSRDRLIEELFADGRPESPDHALRVHVSRLRKSLEPIGDGRIAVARPGYLLRVDPGELDLDIFEAWVEEGRRAMERGDAAHAAARLRDAENLWRGRPLADLEFEPFARIEIERLEEVRLAATEARIEAELALGRHTELVPELEALTAEHPLRERFRSQLMLALYRSDRQADALETYHAGRVLLSRELALEPSPSLRELQQAILRQEPSLELPADDRRAVPAAAPQASSRELPASRKRTRVSLWRRDRVVTRTLAFAFVAAVAAVAAVRLTSHAATVVAANSIGIISPHANRVHAAFRIAGEPHGIAAGAGALWTTDSGNDLLLRIEGDGAVERIPVGHEPTGVAFGGGEVWVVNQLDRTVFELNPRAFRRVATFRVGNGADAIAFGFGSAWVANTIDGTISRIESASGRVRTIPLAATPTAIAVGREGAWITTSAGELLLVDPADDRVTRAVAIGNGPAGVAIGGGKVWVTNTPDATVTRFDPGSDRLTKINVGGAPLGVAYGSGAVWVANGRNGSVDRIDPSGNGVRSIRIGNEPTAVSATGTGVGTIVLSGPNDHRGGTLRVAETPAFARIGSSVDPAVFGGIGEWQMLSLTNDGLVTYRRVGGIAGDTLVPDLATELPSATGDGRTYTFHLREGIRYSNGAVVRPEDFRRAIERVFELGNGYTQSFYTDIVGSATCIRAPRRCTLRRGIATDDSENTVTFQLSKPDPDFLYKLAFPMADAVPASTPDRDSTPHPLPATGPYKTQSVALVPRPLAGVGPRGIRTWTLVRNPRFREWSRDAQPAGYPDRIVLSANVSVRRAVSAVEHGVDVLLSPAESELAVLERRYTTQLHSNPVAATFGFVMNTRAAPFDRLAVRRALNYAIDRKYILALAGGAAEAETTCQILPPTLQGYRPYCPYTISENASGTWTAPDIAKAERLVRASGTPPARVTVLVPPPAPTMPTTAIGRHIVSVLRRLDFRASLRVLSSPTFDNHLADSQARPQIGWFTWYQDYPSPSNFIDPLLTCRAFKPRTPTNGNVAEFCNHTIDEETHRASALDARTAGVAADEWSRIDRQLTNRAVWVPLYNPRTPVMLANRVGNYQYHPFWQVLLDQLWVR